MANFLPSRPRQMTQRRTFAIVASQYNPEFVKGLVAHARQELGILSPNASVSIHEVPGAFEIPLLVQELAARGGIDAIIALGVIIEGETGHAALISGAVTEGLLEIGLRFRLPVIHEVLFVRDEAQAQARCIDTELNRGVEAARVAVQMVHSLGEFKSR